MRGRAEAARQAHNLEVGGSSPPPATRRKRTATTQLQYSMNVKVVRALSKSQHR